MRNTLLSFSHSCQLMHSVTVTIWETVLAREPSPPALPHWKVFKISFTLFFSQSLNRTFYLSKKINSDCYQSLLLQRHTQRSPKVSACHLLSQRVPFMWNHTEFLGLALSVVCKIPISWNRVLRTLVRLQFPAWLPFCTLPCLLSQCRLPTGD